jgi:small-conductance mechanosensitive channel
MRIRILSLAALVVALGVGAQALGQADPNQNPGAALLQQLQENMNNAGVTPRDVIQSFGQQMQDGTFDPQAFRQQLQDSGIINQNMIDQFQQMRNQYQNQNPNRTTQRQVTTLQVVLNATDEEWQILGPRIQRVMDLRSDLEQAADAWQAPQNNFGYAQQRTPIGPVGAALADLRNTLQDPTAPDADVRVKLSAYRDACVKAKADLTNARTDLVNYLTLRQEGILLTMLIVE